MIENGRKTPHKPDKPNIDNIYSEQLTAECFGTETEAKRQKTILSDNATPISDSVST